MCQARCSEASDRGAPPLKFGAPPLGPEPIPPLFSPRVVLSGDQVATSVALAGLGGGWVASPAPYGGEHQRRRKLALKEAYGMPCPRCGEPMLKGQALHFGHAEDLVFNPASKAARMEHADKSDCPEGGNTAAGGRLGRQIQDLRPSRDWLS